MRFHCNQLVRTTTWQGDSDAVGSMDRYEALLWFASRVTKLDVLAVNVVAPIAREFG
jgi:hypothetical protein